MQTHHKLLHKFLALQCTAHPVPVTDPKITTVIFLKIYPLLCCLSWNKRKSNTHFHTRLKLSPSEKRWRVLTCVSTNRGGSRTQRMQPDFKSPRSLQRHKKSPQHGDGVQKGQASAKHTAYRWNARAVWIMDANRHLWWRYRRIKVLNMMHSKWFNVSCTIH